MSKTIILTEEQSSVVFSELPLIVISSGSGVGKTQTLKEFTEERKDKSFLYLTYSEAMKSEARRKFSKHVDVHSISSLAYKNIGKQYKSKIVDNISFEDTRLRYKLSYIETDTVIRTLVEFFNSDKQTPSKTDNPKLDNIINEYFLDMIDPDNKDVKIPHEAYTKYFQILKVKLDYDFVIVDEAQDINKVAKEIIDTQTDSKKIFVGDPYQSIYSYRGTVSLLDEPTHLLSKSFRFGSNIANFVQYFIRDYVDPAYKLSSSLPNGTFNEDKEKFTYISRTNAHLFDKALSFSQLDVPIFIHNSEYLFNLLLDGYYMYMNQQSKIKSKFIKGFKTFNQMSEVSEKIEDLDLRYLVRIVEKYKEDLITHIKLIKRYVVSEEYASVILITTHKSKGLEWDNIELGEDFAPLYDKNRELIDLDDIDEEELLIMYVAMTRAKKNLVLNNDLYMKYGSKLEKF